jgi:Protein of unknown function (DUF3489)
MPSPKTGKRGRAKVGEPGKERRAGRKTAQPTPAKKAGAPRAESKGAKIIAMIRRGKGATLAEIMKTAGWQAHSVREFFSTAGKKHNVKIESLKNEAGDRFYKIAK